MLSAFVTGLAGPELTPREADVLRLAEAGLPTAEIARLLCLTIGTVRNHISAVIVKTGARQPTPFFSSDRVD